MDEGQGGPASIYDVFACNARKWPHNIALIEDAVTLTYGELHNKVEQLSAFLSSVYQIQHKVPVGICMEKSFDFVIAVLALFKLGAVYVPIDKLYPIARIEYMITAANTSFVICDQTCSDDLITFFNQKQSESVAFYLSMGVESWDKVRAMDTQIKVPQPSIQADDPCYICFTSGSTGKPKGVILPHRGALNFMFAAATVLNFQIPCSYSNYTPSENAVPPSELCGCTNGAITFDLSVADIFFPLTMGGRVLIIKSDQLAKVESLVEKISEAQVSLVWMTPSILRLLSDSISLPASLSNIVSFGEPMPASLAKKLAQPNRKVWNWYGPTESSILSTYFLCDNAALNERVDVPIGKPLNNYKTYVLDEQMTEVKEGAIGNLFLGGAGVMLGYTDKIATERALCLHPTNGSTIYKTGDLVRFLSDGNLQYVGRVDRQIKLNGVRMELGEIENSLMSHPLVKQAIIRVGYSTAGPTAKEDLDNRQAFLVAYLFLDSSSKSNGEVFQAMRSYLVEHLPSSMIPSRFIKLDKLPINSHGKLDMNLLPTIFGNETGEEVKDARKSESINQAEELLLDILSPLFQFPLTPNTNILELQEHQNALSSIAQNAHLVKALYDFGINVPQTAIYEHKTIKKLASFIVSATENKYISLPSSVTPLPMQSLPTRENVELCIRTCFENALNASNVGRDDNFFMLGGTSFSAIKLTFLLWKQTGVEITFPNLVQNPTVRQVTTFILSHINLHKDPSPSPHPPSSPSPSTISPISQLPHLSHSTSVKTQASVHVVCLQELPNPEAPKLFLVHPAFWSSVSYLELSNHFKGICGVYGIEGNPGPHCKSMESLADVYVQAVIDIQPEGPYYIAGYSFGAAVAYEMCNQMLLKGIQIGRIGLIAPPLWPKNISPIREFRLMIAVLRRFFDSNFHIPLKLQETTNMDEWFDVVAKQMTKFLPFEAAKNYLQQMYIDAHTSETLMVYYAPPTITNHNLVQMYLPASEYAPFLGKIRNMWTKLCPNLQELSASGDHSNVVYEQHAKVLSELISIQFFCSPKDNG